MAVTLVVPIGVLRRAEQAWGDARDRLAGAADRLGRLESTHLSSDVVAAVRTFVDVWQVEVEGMTAQAGAHEEAFADLALDLEVADVGEAERLRSLLPYAYRGAAIVAA